MRYVSAQLGISTEDMVLPAIVLKQFLMSLSAMSLGDWFCVSRKGDTGGGGFVYTPRG